MAAQKIEFNTGVGRMIGGSLYQGQTQDADGKPYVYKHGAKAGQPRTQYSFGIALRKTQGHWGTEPWGAPIWALGHASWPNGQASRPDFAWKIEDGDSVIPNKKGIKPCDREGYPGHWIIWFSGSEPPPVAVQIDQPVRWEPTPGFCLPGDYIEVRASCVSNESTQTAGLYMNPDAVCMRAYGERISSRLVDLAQAGFGASPLPSGASMQPVGSVAQQPGATPLTPAVPGAPAVPGSAPLPSPASPPVPTPTQTAVIPNPAILGAPAPAAIVAPPAPVPTPATPQPPAPAAPVRQMTAKAGGHSYDALIKIGWTDATLISEGMMLP